MAPGTANHYVCTCGIVGEHVHHVYSTGAVAQTRRPRSRKHRPDERPWEPKRVLREAIASWAVSVRQFAGR